MTANKKEKTLKSKKILNIRKIAATAMLSAISFVLMFIEFPIPMLIPPFIKFDISDLPALLGAFAFGPWTGALIELLKNLLHIVFKGSSSAYVGELCNFILGAMMCITAGYIYKNQKNKKHAIIGAICGAGVMAVISVPINYFIVYPTYVIAYKMPMTVIIDMYKKLLPASNTLLKSLIIFNMPFTFVKGIIDAIICIFIYKPLSPLLHGNK
ncbi:MAG: ECF transporter S component [Candidatus Fimenecus sp.]